MYSYISGNKVYVGAGIAVIDNHGIGYLLNISDRTAGFLMNRNGEVKLYTYLNVREDALELFGFATEDELKSFKMLITVSGVGAKMALSVLSVLSPEKLAMAVLSDDAKAIAAAQGIGLKKAQKIILEIKDKIAKERGNVVKIGKLPVDTETGEIYAGGVSDSSEAVNALIVLGYSPAEAASAVSKAQPDGKPLEKIIKDALRVLSEADRR